MLGPLMLALTAPESAREALQPVGAPTELSSLQSTVDRGLSKMVWALSRLRLQYNPLLHHSNAMPQYNPLLRPSDAMQQHSPLLHPSDTMQQRHTLLYLSDAMEGTDAASPHHPPHHWPHHSPHHSLHHSPHPSPSPLPDPSPSPSLEPSPLPSPLPSSEGSGEGSGEPPPEPWSLEPSPSPLADPWPFPLPLPSPFPVPLPSPFPVPFPSPFPSPGMIRFLFSLEIPAASGASYDLAQVRRDVSKLTDVNETKISAELQPEGSGVIISAAFETADVWATGQMARLLWAKLASAEKASEWFGFTVTARPAINIKEEIGAFSPPPSSPPSPPPPPAEQPLLLAIFGWFSHGVGAIFLIAVVVLLLCWAFFAWRQSVRRKKREAKGGEKSGRKGEKAQAASRKARLAQGEARPDPYLDEEVWGSMDETEKKRSGLRLPKLPPLSEIKGKLPKLREIKGKLPKLR